MQAELKHIVRDVKKKLTYEDVEDQTAQEIQQK